MFILHRLHHMPEICQFYFTWRQINDIVAKDENVKKKLYISQRHLCVITKCLDSNMLVVSI